MFNSNKPFLTEYACIHLHLAVGYLMAVQSSTHCKSGVRDQFV